MGFGSISVSSYSGYSAAPGDPSRPAPGNNSPDRPPQDSKATNADPNAQLSSEQQQQVADLRKRDLEVKAHEAAHVAAGGGYVRGGAQFSYQTGPDGKRYAVGGEVSIDTSPVKDNPSATIIKMEAVRSAALAPANPSGQDRSVAAAAATQEATARQEMGKEKSAAGSSGETTHATGGNGKTATIHPAYNERGQRPGAADRGSSMFDASA